MNSRQVWIADSAAARATLAVGTGWLRAAITLVLIGLLLPSSRAATQSWDGGSRANDYWTTEGNWALDTVPGASDTALFDRGPGVSYFVEFPFVFLRDIVTDRLLIGSNAVTFRNAGHATTGYNVANDVLIASGQDDVAVLNMNLPNMTAKKVVIGNYVYFNNATGTLNIANNSQLTITGSDSSYDGELAVGLDAFGTLNITDGGKVILTGAAGDIALGIYAGIGVAAVSGAGSTLTAARQLSLGDSGGSGALHITEGGRVNSAIGYIKRNDVVTVDGIGSIWSNTGELFLQLGGARLQITNGGTVSNGTAYVGSASAAFDIVQVDGALSSWTNSSMLVGNSLFGNSGPGAVLITNGGHVVSTIAVIGAENAGIGFVGVGSNSTWDAGQIIVGQEGPGFVDVIGGGRVNSSTLYAARGFPASSGSGEVRIDGAGSQWNCTSDIHIGSSYGDGLLEITNGGKLTGKTGYIGATLGPINGIGSASVDGAGSLWTMTTDLNIGIGLNGAGSLSVINGGAVNVGGIVKVGPTGEIHGDGYIVGNVQNGGLVSPGTSPGALHINGNYTQATDGVLLIELASTSYDQLLVSGDAMLDGILQLAFSGLVPVVGDRFTIMNYGSRNGAFASILGQADTPGVFLSAIYRANDLLLLATAPGEKTWGVDASGDASVGSNWIGGVAPGGVGDAAAFTTIITAPRTVTIDMPLTLGTIRFDDDDNYTLAGPNTITLQNSGASHAAINVLNLHGNGQHTISAPIMVASDLDILQNSAGELTLSGGLATTVGRTITKTGPGTLSIAGLQSYGVGAQLSHLAGTLNLLTDAGGGGANLDLDAQSLVNFTSSQHLAALQVGSSTSAVLSSGGGKVLATRAVTISAGGTLDLTDNDFVLHSTSANRLADAAAVRSLLAAGFAAFAWNGPGIASSAAATDPALLTALGMMLNDDGLGGPYRATFSGEPVDANSVLVKYTYYGDADLSGAVDGTDYALIDNGFNAGLSAWFNGDFDYSGVIDGTDYALIDNAFNNQTGPLAAGPLGPAVPEPSSWALALLGICLVVAGNRGYRGATGARA